MNNAAPPRRIRLGAWAALAVPFVIAAVVLHGRHWNPVLDMAMTELRVRDVGTRHTPLIGLPGRIGVFPDQGSHPGPLSFYLLAPTYRLAGSSAWGLLAGMIVLNLVAVGLALWLARRRGGAPLAAAARAIVIADHREGSHRQQRHPPLQPTHSYQPLELPQMPTIHRLEFSIVFSSIQESTTFKICRPAASI